MADVGEQLVWPEGGCPLGPAGRAQTAALAGEGEQELLLALGATDTGKAVVENAAVEVAGHHAVNETAPEAGAFSVKSYNQPRRDQLPQILAAARELQMMVVTEGGSLFQHNITMVVEPRPAPASRSTSSNATDGRPISKPTFNREFAAARTAEGVFARPDLPRLPEDGGAEHGPGRRLAIDRHAR